MTSLKRNARQIQFTGDPTDITGRLGKKKDVFYRFRLARSSDISLTLDGFAAKANVDLFLLNRKNRVLRKSTKPGNAAESISTALKPGEYLIRVQNKRSKTKTSFQLQIATTTPLSAPTPSPSTTPSPTGEVKSLMRARWLKRYWRHSMRPKPPWCEPRLSRGTQRLLAILPPWVWSRTLPSAELTSNHTLQVETSAR
ncbi:PPC domain-containing protein [Leptolyngbya sp. 7M]|nr:PPC domain-containing protein [Leptolyngbya sp. 7M]